MCDVVDQLRKKDPQHMRRNIKGGRERERERERDGRRERKERG